MPPTKIDPNMLAEFQLKVLAKDPSFQALQAILPSENEQCWERSHLIHFKKPVIVDDTLIKQKFVRIEGTRFVYLQALYKGSNGLKSTCHLLSFQFSKLASKNLHFNGPFNHCNSGCKRVQNGSQSCSCPGLSEKSFSKG
jgi:hypothetical protein